MDLSLWDAPLWEPCDDQSYPIILCESNYTAGHGWNGDSCQGLDQSGYYVKDPGKFDFTLRSKYDTIEEDALNEKCCIQVLKALIHKADEDILTLEEHILMLECQLEWDNEEFSEPCFAVLNKMNDHLDDLIQCFKNEVNYVHDLSAELEEPGKLTQRLHDLLKPLLENYFLVNRKKTGSCNVVVPTLPSGGTSNETMETNTCKFSKVDAKKQVSQMREDLSMEPKERETNLPKQEPIAEKAALENTEDKKTLGDLKSIEYQRTTENTCTPLTLHVKKAKTATHKVKSHEHDAGSCNVVVPTLPADGTSNKAMGTNTYKLSKKVFTKKQVYQMKEDMSMEPKERMYNLPKPGRIAEKAAVKNTEDKKTLNDLELKEYQGITENTCTPFTMPVKKAKTTTHKGPVVEKAATKDTDDKKTLSDLKWKGYQRTADNTSTPFTAPAKKAKTATHKKREDILSKIFKNAHQCAKDKNKLNRHTGKEVPKSAPTMYEKTSIITSEAASVSIVKQDTNPSRTNKSDSRGSDLVGIHEILSTAKVHRLESVHEITTNSYLKTEENVGEVIQPCISIVKQDTNPSRTNTLPGSNEVLSSAEVHRLQFVHEVKMTNSHLKLQEKNGKVFQPSISVFKEDTNPSRTKKSDSRGSGLLGNNDEVPSTAEVHGLKFVHEVKTTFSYLKSQGKVGEVVQPAYVIYGEQMSEQITETRETRAYRHAINKDFFSKKPLVKKRKWTSFPERTNTLETRESENVEFDDSVTLLELFNRKRKNPRKVTVQTTDKHEGQQIVNNLVTKLDNSKYHVKPDQGPENTYVRKQEIASITCIPEETQGLSWTDKGDALQGIHTLVST